MATQTGRNVKVEIAATYAAAKTVTAITLADPGVASSTAHGLANGTVGYFADDVAGMVQIAGAAASVANQASGTFELEGEATTGYSAFTSGTFVPVATWATLSTSTGYEIPNAEADDLDVTTLLDVIKKSEGGLLAAQNVTISGFSDAQNAAVILCRKAALAGGYVVVKMTLNNGERRIFRAMPSAPGESMSVGQKATSSVGFKVKGRVLMLPAVAA